MSALSSIPDWVRSAVFYEIYPQTFFDTNGHGIGDLPGITAKLDYVQSLGANAIWLNPFYRSPMRDAGYDVADFRAVDPRYGTNEDARRLFREAAARGLRVLIDFVPGLTSIDHPWFIQSARPEPNPYSNWYVWTQSAWDNGGEKWKGKMVHGYSDRNGNYLINFFWSQPALNFGFAEPDPDQPWQLPTTHPLRSAPLGGNETDYGVLDAPRCLGVPRRYGRFHHPQRSRRPRSPPLLARSPAAV